ncbi:hypothetical protein [Pedococcus sp. 2YAF34]|uniref:hypothetical protein n=1 Tax=Pedococcus sp. 2YAF34 TaxID=3233032 RepID=UPI003F9D632D
MGVTVEAAQIRARTTALRRTGPASVQVRVALKDPNVTDVQSVTAALATAVDARWGGEPAVHPATGGLWVIVPGESRWKDVVETIRATLDTAGVTATLCAPPLLDVDSFLPGRPVAPTVFAGLTMATPLADLPVNPYGVPEFRWGVAPAATAEVLTSTLRWLDQVGGDMEVRGAGPTIPLDAAGGMAVLHANLRHADQWLVAHALSQPPDLYRAANIGHWGQATFTSVTPDEAGARTAESLAAIVTALSAFLDSAAVWLANPLFPSWSSLPHGPQWILRRDLWSTHVLDVAGIQVLGSGQLDRAADLGAWTVQEVAPDRWLVQAHDLEAWYQPPDESAWGQGRFPDPGLVEQARRDFGELVIRPEALHG